MMRDRTISQLFTVALVLGALAAPQPARAGGADSSGGGDTQSRDPGNAWFLGKEKTIRACIEIADDFGAGREFAESQIQRAFEKWRIYMEAKLVRAATHVPTSRVVILESCAEADLRFYLGVENDAVREAKRAYQDPSAMAHRERYDVNQGWGKGFIWIPSGKNWPSRDNLLAILLHEIGHVLGNDHVPGTIMDATIVSRVKNLGEYEKNAKNGDMDRIELTEIDQRHELMLCKACVTEHRGVVSLFNRYPFKEKAFDPRELRQLGVRWGEETFELLTGRAPTGPVFARWQYRPSLGKTGFKRRDKITLYLSDRAGEVAFPIKAVSPYTLDFGTKWATELYPHVFDSKPIPGPSKAKNMMEGIGEVLGEAIGEAMSPLQEAGGLSTTLHGILHTNQGRKLAVIIERNSAFPGPVRMLYIDGGRAHELMVSWSAHTQANPYK